MISSLKNRCIKLEFGNDRYITTISFLFDENSVDKKLKHKSDNTFLSFVLPFKYRYVITFYRWEDPIVIYLGNLSFSLFFLLSRQL